MFKELFEADKRFNQKEISFVGLGTADQRSPMMRFLQMLNIMKEAKEKGRAMYKKPSLRVIKMNYDPLPDIKFALNQGWIEGDDEEYRITPAGLKASQNPKEKKA